MNIPKEDTGVLLISTKKIVGITLIAPGLRVNRKKERYLVNFRKMYVTTIFLKI